MSTHDLVAPRSDRAATCAVGGPARTAGGSSYSRPTRSGRSSAADDFIDVNSKERAPMWRGIVIREHDGIRGAKNLERALERFLVRRTAFRIKEVDRPVHDDAVPMKSILYLVHLERD